MLFARDGWPAGLPGFGGLAPLVEPGIAGGPDGGGGRPGTELLLPPPLGGGVREVPGSGGAPAGGFALEAPAAADAANDEPEPAEPTEVAGFRTSTPAPAPTPAPGRGGLTAVGLVIPAPARRSFEMGAGRFGAGFASSSPPPLMKAPSA